MRLGIISDCVHYKTPNGLVGTEVHILRRQLETLSSYFSETVICCPFGEYDPSKVITTYSAGNINFLPVPMVGGDGLKDKLKIVAAFPKWIGAFKKINASSDIVYQRFPNNLNIPGFFYFYFKNKNVFGTYTGTWANYPSEPSTYRFQKWLLKKYFKGPVWVYVDKQQVDERTYGGFSPSYSINEWDEETQQVEQRIRKIEEEGMATFRLITVGTLISYKNQLTILKACVILKSRNFPFSLAVVGNGPMYDELNQFIQSNNLQQQVILVGKKTSEQLRVLYRNADFVVQAPLAEGFGKVPVEGFFHGVVPVINNISMAQHITGNGERGFLFNAADPENLADTIEGLKERVTEMPLIIKKGREYAKTQTLEAWAEAYYKTVVKYFEKA